MFKANKKVPLDIVLSIDFELKKRGRPFHWVTLHINSQKFKQLEINFHNPINVQKFASKLTAYGLTQEQADIIAQKEKEADFNALIEDLNAKVRSGKLKMDKSVAYLVGVYQKKGILPNKS